MQPSRTGLLALSTATLILGASCKMDSSCAGPAEKLETPGGYWILAWSDEFSVDGRPDPAKWGYEEGFVRNHELQYYTKDRPENVRVEGGMLVIEGRKEPYQDKGKAAQYTSASLQGLGKADFTYGRIEARAKVPFGKGVWPAIWTLGVNIPAVNWPACGEIDIMEFVGKEPKRIHGTIHYKNSQDGKHKQDGKAFETPAPPYDDFHVYAVEWTPERIDFYFDDVKYHSVALADAAVDGQNPFQKPHYLIVNLALGGDWGGAMDDSVLPQKFLVDYIRVYKASNAK